MKTFNHYWLVQSSTFLFCLIGFAQMLIAGGQDDRLKSELGERQRFVERKMVELENKFTAVAEKLKEDEPKKYERLIAAYQYGKEKLITNRMAQASELLDAGKNAEAGKLIDQVIVSLDELVVLLTNRKKPKITKEQEIEMLQDWKNKIQNLKNEQTQQRRETHKVANKKETLQKLAEQIKQLENLIDQQKSVIGKTQNNSDAGLRTLDKIANQQFKIRKQTENLIKQISSGGDKPKTGETANSEAGPDAQPNRPPNADPPSSQNPKAPNESQNSGTKSKQNDSSKPPSDPKSGDPKSGDPKSGDPKSGDSKSGDSKSGDSKSGEKGKQSSSQPSPGSPSGQPKAQPRPPQPGQKPLQQAAEHQRKSEEKLGSGRPQDAEQEQKKSLDEMQNAKRELKKEFRRLESLPPEAFEQMANKQRRTRNKALELNEKMAEAPKATPEKDDNQVADQQQPSQPGQQKMQQAGDAMKQAGEDLQKNDAEQAEDNQRKAEKKMDEALQEIEERLNQLRDETMEEKLKRLEARFREMQERQQVASVMTIELDEKKMNLNLMQRRDQLTLMRLAGEEFEISELGQQANDLLLEDGTSEVIPQVVQSLCDDLKAVAEMLENERTDELVQFYQKDIEMTLLDLLDAMAESKKKNKQSGGGGGGGGGGKQPLIKQVTELKILQSRQIRLNGRTKRIADLQEKAKDLDLEGKLKQELRKLTDQQSQIQEMTERIMEKMDK